MGGNCNDFLFSGEFCHKPSPDGDGLIGDSHLQLGRGQ